MQRQQQLSALLDRLDARDAADNGRADRRNTRVSYRKPGVRIVVHHPGGSVTERTVLTRDVSAGGLSFVHGGYLHVGTRCDVTLDRHVGGSDTVRGQVQNCEHIAGTWHTVGLKFDRRIFPRLYLDPDQASELDGETRSPQTLGGRVLVIDPSELDRRLLQHHLRRTKIEVTGVSRLADAVEAVLRQIDTHPFALAVTELAFADEAAIRGGEVVRRLLDAGLPKVAACTAELADADVRAVRDAGACGVLHKPYDGDKLVACVAGWMA